MKWINRQVRVIINMKLRWLSSAVRLQREHCPVYILFLPWDDIVSRGKY